jgi:hypothetical protein
MILVWARRRSTLAFALVHGVICPMGRFAKSLSSPLRKNISLSLSGKLAPSRLDQRGVRVVTDVAADAVATQDERR